MIKFDKVVKKFGERIVLNEISFEIAKGQIVFILGTSGTGKSVLLKNIVGLLTPDSGEIFIDGAKVSHLTEDQYFEIRKTCGMVFQQPALFDSLTVLENVAFGLRRLDKIPESELHERVLKCLRLVNLKDVEHKKPQDLSYGMQKRVSLARTLALNPKILLFDEPTTGLDPVTTQAINELIQDLSRTLQTTSLVVSHDMESALSLADRIIVLDKGQVVADGSPDEMRSSSNALVRYFLSEVTS